MTIGFSNGVFHRIHNTDLDRFDHALQNDLALEGANAFELHCLNEAMMDHLLNTALDLSHFSYLSMHAPSLPYACDTDSRRLLTKLQAIAIKYQLQNVVFHPDTVKDWDVFDEFIQMPTSIENMDEQKISGRTIEDIGSILEEHDLDLTLDLQHCYVNDPSMKLANDFHNTFKDKIVEYHLSGYHKDHIHYGLFQTKQAEIIRSLQFRSKPIIIESTFDTIGDQEKELSYIIDVFEETMPI